MTSKEAIKHLSEWMDEKMWRCFGTIDREAIGMAIDALQEPSDDIEGDIDFHCDLKHNRMTWYNNITESPNEVDEKNDEVIDHDRKWIIGCIKHDGFIKTDRFDKANQIILEALEPTEPSDLIRQETIKELGDWLEQMIQHGVPSYSAKRKALANAIALLSMDTHEIHTETHECVKETHDSDLISRADAIGLVKKICWNCSNTICINLINAFKALPSVSTAELLAELGVATFDELMEEPSAERVGVWLHKEMWNDVLDKNISYIECSECGHAPYYGGATETPNYCPNCGAKMKGGAE